MRKSGILMPVASLPGPYGIGSLGKPAFAFIDFLKKAGQKVWQMLPLSPTGFGDSPYQSCSAFAGNPYFIDLDILRKKGLLKKGEYGAKECCTNEGAVDYAALYHSRYGVLRKAFARFSTWYPDDYYRFCYEQGWWLEDYALYMTAKGLYEGKSYLEWPEPVRSHTPEAIRQLYAEHEAEVHFWKFCQYEFSLQWTALKAYAGENGIEIMGDIPIYVAADSADVWAAPELFLLDACGAPKEVAGCPPDAFSDAGQLWGNPLYDWANRLCLVGAAHPLCPEFLRYSAHRPFPRLRHLLCHPLRREDRPNGRVAQRPGHEAVSRREAGAGGCAHRGRGLGRAVSQRI